MKTIDLDITYEIIEGKFSVLLRGIGKNENKERLLNMSEWKYLTEKDNKWTLYWQKTPIIDGTRAICQDRQNKLEKETRYKKGIFTIKQRK